MSTYVSKPSKIEAVQWTGDNIEEVRRFMDGASGMLDYGEMAGQVQLMAGKDGAQGIVDVPVGHWIVRQPGDVSDHWPVAPSYFEAKYEPVEGGR